MEIRLMRAVNNVNVIAVKNIFETDKKMHFILELNQGGNLADRINSKIKFSTNDMSKILLGIVKGLVKYIYITINKLIHFFNKNYQDALHEKNIMHRDLKPENILFRQEDMEIESPDDIVLADLGLGTFANEE